jgi:DNA-binding response OmpR family regulator
VDDDPIAVRIYRDGLIRQGFEVSTAGDGLAALKALRAAKPDAVVLDLMMPKLSGVEVLKFMRAEKQFEKIPVIVLSNAYMDPLAQDAAELGAQKGLLKVKCNPASLALALREVLEGGPAGDTGDQLLATVKAPEVKLRPAAPKDPAPAAPASAAKEDVPVHEVDAREQARQELSTNAASIGRNLGELFQSFKTAPSDREREMRLHAFYRKVHFITAMAGMAEYQATAQMASCFEAMLFSMMDKLPKLEPSLERTTAMTVQFLQELLVRPPDSRPQPAQNLWTLVVDDDRLLNRLVISALRNAQLQARGTESPETALRMLQEKHYDLLLLDVEMPGMDGFQLCKKVRELPGYERTPVIYVTLHSDFETRAKTILSGATDLIAKPVSPAELAVKVLTHLLKTQMTASPG